MQAGSCWPGNGEIVEGVAPTDESTILCLCGCAAFPDESPRCAHWGEVEPPAGLPPLPEPERRDGDRGDR